MEKKQNKMGHLEPIGITGMEQIWVYSKTEIDLSLIEYGLLEKFFEMGYMWLARNKSGILYAFKNFPRKRDGYWETFGKFQEILLIGDKDFSFVTTDDPRAYSIGYVLTHCVVKNRIPGLDRVEV